MKVLNTKLIATIALFAMTVGFICKADEPQLQLTGKTIEKAEQGNANAQFKLGLMYVKDKDVLQDYKQAVKWFTKAAEQGHAMAQYFLGLMYYNGEGVSQDYKQAAKWYTRAAEQGVADAQCNLGLMYYAGEGVSQDYKEAVKWFTKAAGQGHAKAQFMLTKAAEQGVTGGLDLPIRPVVPTLEQVSNVSSFRLGQGYRAVKSTISTLETVIKFPNVTIMLNIDGEMVKITQENAPGILKAFKERLQVYRRAIRQRGHRKINGWYTVQVNEALEGEEGFDMVELFANAKLSSKEYLLAREIQIKQKDFDVQMVREIDFGGEKKDVSFPGLTIGDSIVFEVSNIKIHFYGTLHDDTIELRMDLNEVKRSLSFKHAMQPLVDPEKAKDSELYKENFSEWMVRLKRKPSNRPAVPSSADQLLVLTPDKKLRKVVRAKISPTPQAEEPHTKN